MLAFIHSDGTCSDSFTKYRKVDSLPLRWRRRTKCKENTWSIVDLPGRKLPCSYDILSILRVPKGVMDLLRVPLATESVAIPCDA